MWRFSQDESGQDILEYSLLLSVVALFVAATIGPSGGVVPTVLGIWKRIADAFV